MQKLFQNVTKAIPSLMVLTTICVAAVSCGNDNSEKATLNVTVPDKFEGKEVSIVTFLDSVTLAADTVRNGSVNITLQTGDSITTPLMTQLMIDGRIKAFYILEPGNATSDSLNVVKGTPLNDRFAEVMTSMDSVENLDDMDLYVKFAEEQYNRNKESVIGQYLWMELLKFSSPEKVDSLLKIASPELAKSPKALNYKNRADLRRATSPGRKYVDFEGEDANGKAQKFSALVGSGKYTLVDFWASWCPYCIKEIPQLKELVKDFGDKNFQIVGVAVRDDAVDTRASVESREIPWKILYNTQRKPYDIYGFVGIPHLMLIGPDGIIISRGETPGQIRARLEKL